MNSPSRNFMNSPGNNIERRDDMIAVHDQKSHLQEIISPSRGMMMPTTKEIREMTESRRVALGLQSRAYGNHNYKSVTELPKDGVPRSKWERAEQRNDHIDSYKGLRTINEAGPGKEYSARNFMTHDDRNSRGGFDGQRDQQIGYNKNHKISYNQNMNAAGGLIKRENVSNPILG